MACRSGRPHPVSCGWEAHTGPRCADGSLLKGPWLLQAADVYSFGVILWEMCTGQRAWAALNFAQVRLLAMAWPWLLL